MWSVAWPQRRIESCLREENSVLKEDQSWASVKRTGVELSDDRTRDPVRTGDGPQWGPELVLIVDWSWFSVKSRARPQRSKVMPQGGAELNHSEKKAWPL